MLTLFAGAVSAVFRLGSVEIQAVSMLAATEGEAQRLLLEHAKDRWPVAVGYTQHTVTLVVIPDWQMSQALSSGTK